MFVANPRLRKPVDFRNGFEPILYADNFERKIYSLRHSGMPLRKLAWECCLSLTPFKRTFKLHFGCPPQQWFLAQRLMKALWLVKTGDMPIDEMADECMFSNPSHLIFRFRDMFGCTPAAFRKIYRQRIAQKFGMSFDEMSESDKALAASNDDTHLLCRSIDFPDDFRNNNSRQTYLQLLQAATQVV